MLRRGAAAAVLVAALGLAGCEGRMRAEAAESAARLLAAAAADDRVGFEAEIDRPAVREDLRRQMIDVARSNLGVEVEGGPSDFALDRMIGPDAVQLDALTRTGAAPTADELKKRLKIVGEKRVCLPAIDAEDLCLLTFGKAAGDWRLVGMRATGASLQLAAR